ncbi:hypothetical protein M3I54_02965 [Paraburkholderia sp. CNPSo 3274]|uniref:hypothetical protein n=1 Tax=Paraburkholderia sp. CNPSo 3274 TaxID=2940932 RepID=UPI0020B82BF5|nr:hypothetical protein [Paraburkholderia sp. CNPSo 3274]MCP3705957.1 hypothetical protein [Paraburkholderia sp. CNPSo 3274]
MRAVAGATVIVTMAAIGPAQVHARVVWFAVARRAGPGLVAIVVTTAFPRSVVTLPMPRLLAARATTKPRESPPLQ